MSDAADWSSVGVAVYMIELCIDGYCLNRLIKPFVQQAKVALAAGITYFLAMIVLYVIPPHMGIFTAYLLGSFIAFLVMCIMERRNYTQKAFFAITYFSLRWFTAAMADILYDYLYKIVENTAWYKGNPPMYMQFMVYVGGCAFYLIMVFMITYAAICFIIKSYVYKYEQMSKRELFMLVIPPLLGVVGYKIIRYYRVFYILESRKLPQIYDLLLFVYCSVAVTVVVILIILYQNIKAEQEEKLANQMLSTQIDDLKRHIGQVENLYKDIRGMKHDMTNHILTLERLYTGNGAAQAQEYANELKAVLLNVAVDGIKSGNPITDTILQEWKTDAEKRNIRFDSDFHFPTDSNINAFDISVILNNALQNAVENTEGEKDAYIGVKSYRRDNAYMIEISNSFEGTLRWDVECGLPITSKSKIEGHGYGLHNIRNVARKYFGDIDIVLNNDEFVLSVMLMIE
ncbi:MAG: GHKL domain-containing protein [Lachnospiraceae bacterium]|nr:GHKL domain-containing protein [Lachnospiraceae bacterium]